MDELLALIQTHNGYANTYSADMTNATPDWAATQDIAHIRDLLWTHAVHNTQKGPTVIPAAAKQLKDVNVDIVVTRDGTRPLSVTAYTAFGALVLWWDRDSLLYWMTVHQGIHAVDGDAEPTRKMVVVHDERPFLARASEALRNLFTHK